MSRCPFTNASNTIFIRLSSNMPLLSGSRIHISGLMGFHRVIGTHSPRELEVSTGLLDRFGKLSLHVKDGLMLLPHPSACHCAHTLPGSTSNKTARLASFDTLDVDGDGCIREAEFPALAELTFACIDDGNSTASPGCITRDDFRDQKCSTTTRSLVCRPWSNTYNVTIELDNGGAEQESPDMFTQGTALIESPSAGPGRTVSFALPKLVFSTVRSQEAFGVAEGKRPMKLVQPAFEVLGPFYQTNPRNTHSLSTSLQLVLQFNVRMAAGSYITFKGFHDMHPSRRRHGAQISCLTPAQTNLEGHAEWNEEEESFRIHLLDALHPRTLYTIKLDVELTERPDVVERESHVWVDALVEAGRKDSMIPARRARLVVDVGNQAPSFTLVTERIVALEDGRLAARLAKDVSAGPPGVYLESESNQETSFSVNIVPAASGWSPLFRPGEEPRLSSTGELTFGLTRAADALALGEHESHGFQLEVTLRDDGGAEHGGHDTSDAVLVDVVVIGSPQAPRSVLAMVHEPRSIRVEWNNGVDAMPDPAATEASPVVVACRVCNSITQPVFTDSKRLPRILRHSRNEQVPGRILYHLVELRSWSAAGHLEVHADGTVMVPGANLVLHELVPGRVYYPLVLACNALKCSSPQSGKALTALDIPSQPILQRIERRSVSEIILEWHAPADVGEGSAFDPTLHQTMEFRLEMLAADFKATLSVYDVCMRTS